MGLIYACYIWLLWEWQTQL